MKTTKKVLALLLAFTLLLTACGQTTGTNTEKATYTLHALQFEVEGEFVIKEFSDENYIEVYFDKTGESYFHVSYAAVSPTVPNSNLQLSPMMYSVLNGFGEISGTNEITETNIGGQTAWTITTRIIEGGTRETEYTMWSFVRNGTLYALLYVAPPESAEKHLPKVEAMVSSMRFVVPVVNYSAFGMVFETTDEWEITQMADAVFIQHSQRRIQVSLGLPVIIDGDTFNRQSAEDAVNGYIANNNGQASPLIVSETTVGECIAYMVQTNVAMGGRDLEITYWAWQREGGVYTCSLIAESGMHDDYLEEVSGILNSITYDGAPMFEARLTLGESNIFEENGIRFDIRNCEVEFYENECRIYMPNNAGDIVFSRYPLAGDKIDKAFVSYIAEQIFNKDVYSFYMSGVRETTINGYTALVVETENKMYKESPGASAIIWVFEREDTFYLVYFITYSENYECYLPDAQSIINTIEFTD